jgi:peptidoglycan pentaglycine glycine transferase (the first glycine)
VAQTLSDLRTVSIAFGDARTLALYDHYVRTGPKSHILQTVAWGELKSRTGWTPVRYLVQERKTGRGRGAMSVLLRRLPLPFARVYLGYAPRGPVIDYEDQEALSELFGAAAADLRRRGGIALKIDPDIKAERTDIIQRLEELGLRRLTRGLGFEGVQPRFVFRLSLRDEPARIMASFQPKTRYNIRLAQRRGVTVRAAAGRDDLGVFYRILMETARRDGFLVRAESYYQDMWDILMERGLARLFLADHEGKTLAGAIIFILGDKAWYVYGASSSSDRDLMPNYLLQWTMICWAKDRGCTLYDFRGVSGNLDPTDPLYGLFRFKKGFGAEFTEFAGEFDLVLSPLWYQVYTVGEPLYRRLRSRLRGGAAKTTSAAEDTR